ncbi:radical SAM protein [Candidatus Giovannonibacteria bacterium]|nr:radical SAM protein [Candidatus Giovannonibacteria bacterium]
MKVLLLNIEARSDKKCINKDLAGGMGTGTWIGNSLRARIFEKTKKSNVVLPVITSPYLAAIFKKGGWEVKVLHIGKGTDVPDKKADLALVPTSIVDCTHEKEIARILKDRGICTGVYGTFATTVPEFFKNDSNFVMQGEPEAVAMQIIASGKLPEGNIFAPPVENPDVLPFPDWDQFPVEKYSYSPALNKRPVLTMLASRGCPYSCFFYCPYPINAGRKWRMRSVGNVIDEMVYLKERYGIKAVDFRDANFSVDMKRAAEFSERLREKNLGVIWSAETRIDRLDKPLIDKMYEAGLRHFNFGIESSDVGVLKSSNRMPVEYRHQEDILAYCRKKGITVAAFYILGLESDTVESFKETVSYAKKLNTLVAQFSISTPYPGTQFYQKMKEENRIISKNWEDYDEYTPTFKHAHLSADELLSLKEYAFTSYYFRPGYLLKYMPKYFFEKYLWRF